MSAQLDKSRSRLPSEASDIAAASETIASQRGSFSHLQSSGHSFPASQWFEDSNRNVLDSGSKGFIDDDPPFYLRKKPASSGHSTYSAAQSEASGPAPDLRGSTPRARCPSSVDDQIDDFRSVIDDLTVENRELRKQLKRFEQLHHAPMQDERLFELHVHGLPASKKRKLEKTLQAFASSVTNTCDPVSLPSAYEFRMNDPRGLPATFKPPSSPASNWPPVDSAYASISTSGAASARPSRQAAMPNEPRDVSGKSVECEPSSDGSAAELFPRALPSLPQKARQQLVVRRLEQLFTGKENRTSQWRRSQERQRVHDSAKCGHRPKSDTDRRPVSNEGLREAKMFGSTPSKARPPTPSPTSSTKSGSRDIPGRGDVTPDQRPTHPVDLDPSRAQNPTDNIMYMKHLGFGSPKRDPNLDFREGEGWVPFNLLMNMAQLHTAHVTPDFVRTAVEEVSAKFELSQNGQSIRWKGGDEGTRMINESAYSTGNSSDSPPIDAAFPRPVGGASFALPPAAALSKAKVDTANGHFVLSRTAGYGPCSSSSGSHVCQSKARYQPLLFHGADLARLRTPSPGARLLVNNSTGDEAHKLDLSHAEESDRQQEGSDTTGPIIFYKTASFYVDLSRDVGIQMGDHPFYRGQLQDVLGISGSPCNVTQGPDVRKGPLSSSRCAGSLGPLESTTHPWALDLDWPCLHAADCLNYDSTPNAFPVPLAASGLGGVHPEDHFTLEVHTERPNPLSREGPPRQSFVRRKAHPPVSLPPPSYAVMPHSSSSSDGEDCDDRSDEEDSDAASVVETPELALGSVPRTCVGSSATGSF